MDFKRTQQALELFAKAIVLKAKTNLKSKSPTPKAKNQIGSGKLHDSVSYALNVSKNSFSLEFYMEDYGPFIDQGVRGSKSTYSESVASPFKYSGAKKMIPTRSLDKWLVRKKLAPRKNGKFADRKSIKYAIAKSVYEKGIRASKFFTRPFEEEFKNIDSQVQEAFGLDLNDFLIKTQVV